MSTEDPLYLVDGSGYIFRAYYAVQPLWTKKGFPTNALLGFTRMLGKLVRDTGARYIAVAFDTGSKTFRHEMYDEYKANRAECPENLVPQMPYFRKIVHALGMQGLEKVGFEADDIIATLAVKAHAEGRRVVVVSGDKDLTQLVTEGIEVWDPMRDVLFTPEKVKEKFGVRPEQMRDYLAIIGDSSDNIPGVKGIGPKGAQRLLEEFASIDEMLENLERIRELKGLRGAKSIAEKIELHREQLRLSKQLVELDRLVEPFTTIPSVEEFAWEHAREEEIGPLFEELELNSLKDTFALAPGRSSGSSDSDQYSGKEYKILAESELEAFAAELAAVPAFAFDTETSSLDPLSCDLVGISISIADNSAVYLPISGDADKELHIPKQKIISALGEIFSNAEIKKYGANLKFDIQVLHTHGITVKGCNFDAMLCAYVLDPDKRDFGLKSLALKHLGESMKEYKEVLGEFEEIGQVPVETVAKYACHDADASWRLQAALFPLLEGANAEEEEAASNSPRHAFEQIEMPLVPVLAAMEREGVKLDRQMLASLGTEFTEALSELKETIHALAGEEFNLNSPKQLGVILFEKLGIPTKGIKKTKSGFSTNAAMLERMRGQHEIVEKILEYREIHKLNSTYIEALQRLCREDTGRIHASFNQAIAATGRLSSSDPNLQNIPIKNARGRRIRNAFIAEEGNVLIAADYSQIELRVLAHLCGDAGLVDAFVSGEDIHERTAREIFGSMVSNEEERKELRRAAKTINFGLIYGMGAFRLAGDLGVSRKQAQEYIDNYFARYPGVSEYFDELRAFSSEKGFVETLFGHRRYADTLDTSGRDSGYAERSMLNAPLQGTAAEIIKLAMIKLHARLAKTEGNARIVLQVHDELVVEVAEKDSARCCEVVVEEMESAVELLVPLKVDVRVSPTWGDEPASSGSYLEGGV